MSSTEIFPRPTGTLKRKLNDPTTSFARTSSKKSAKHSEIDSPNNSGRATPVNGSKTVSVQDVPEVDEEDDQEAGPSLPPDDDAEDEPEDDEEGRFFGGGVSKQEKDVLDYIEHNEGDEPDEEINLIWLKRTALNFERKINKNAELRAKYEDDPMKFVASEADLDSEIKGLSLLSEHPELYRDFVRSGCSDSLVGLLAHDNTDIAIAAVELIADMIDDDSGPSPEDWATLVKSILKADLIGLLVSNLDRLDEKVESDNAGVYHVLTVMENLLSDTSNAERLGSETKLLQYLLKRIAQSDSASPNNVSQNRQYAAEILVILAQNSIKNVDRLIKHGAIDVILQLLSTWRRRDPEENSDEEEFAGNLFDLLIMLVKTEAGRAKFVEDEGIELCLLMMKEGKFSRAGALRVIDHGADGFNGVSLYERLVEAGGLKQIFTLLMKSKKLERESKEHLIGIMSSLLRLLPPGSSARIRNLAKFTENAFEKCKRLLELRLEYAERLAIVDQRIAQEVKALPTDGEEVVQDEHLSQRLDAGLFSLQTIDVILAWLMAEDEGAKTYLSEEMARHNMDAIRVLRSSLQAQLEGIDIEESVDKTASMQDMLKALLESLA